jgi:hypothetical protein
MYQTESVTGLSRAYEAQAKQASAAAATFAPHAAGQLGSTAMNNAYVPADRSAENALRELYDTLASAQLIAVEARGFSDRFSGMSVGTTKGVGDNPPHPSDFVGRLYAVSAALRVAVAEMQSALIMTSQGLG